MRERCRPRLHLAARRCQTHAPVLERLGADGPRAMFIHPLFDAGGHQRAAAVAADEDHFRRDRAKLLPANRALHEYLRNEYLPRARAGLALSELPLGAAWYAYRIKRATSTRLTADEVHRIGLAEVERLRARAPPRDAERAPASGTAGRAARRR